ncbi:MAG: HepT-like ribonuclease domain-containing protein [Victivallales bacterium]
MRHEIDKYLEDIKQAIEIIEERTQGMKYEDYSSDLTIQDSVNLRLLIIGEAMNHILKLDPAVNISQTREIIGMRNRIVHGYDNILDSIVWDTITEGLPTLKCEVKKLLKK